MRAKKTMLIFVMMVFSLAIMCLPAFAANRDIYEKTTGQVYLYSEFMASDDAFNDLIDLLDVNPSNYIIEFGGVGYNYGDLIENYNVNTHFDDVLANTKQEEIPTRTETEKENNNSIEEANRITVNKEYSGNMSSYNDVDYYKFTLNSKGKININFKHPTTENARWRINVLDSNNTSLFDFYSDEDDINLYSNDLRLPQGIYYVKIYTSTFSNVDYRFTVNYFEEDANYETEFNNTLETANSINTNSFYTGNISQYNDEDFYRFVLDTKGKISINFKHPTSSNARWRINILDSNNNTVSDFYSDEEDINVDSRTLRLPRGVYYVKIYTSTFSNVSYSFVVNYTREDNNYESEFNNSLENANEVMTNIEYTGNISDYNDVDYYRFYKNETGKITVYFNHPSTSNARWRINILDSNNNTVSDFYSDEDEMVKYSDSIQISPGYYYLKIYTSTFNNADYRFSINS